MQQDPASLAEDVDQQQLVQRGQEMRERPWFSGKSHPFWPEIEIARSQIRPHHRELNRWMRGHGIEDFKDRVSIRAKEPPVIAYRVKDHGFRRQMG